MEFKLIDIENIRLDVANPRIADRLTRMTGSEEEMQEFIKEHLAGDTGNSEPGPSCLELKKSIKQSNGIIEPIIISAAWSTSFLILFTISSTSKRVKSSPPVILIKRPLAPFNE